MKRLRLKEKEVAKSLTHYYGHYVRRFFVGGGISVLVALPFLNIVLPIPVLTTTAFIVVLVILAAFTNPVQLWVNVANVVVSAVAVLMFQYFSIGAYLAGDLGPFAVQQSLALLFVFALYFSAKTYRAIILDQIGEPDPLHPPTPKTFHKLTNPDVSEFK